MKIFFVIFLILSSLSLPQSLNTTLMNSLSYPARDVNVKDNYLFVAGEHSFGIFEINNGYNLTLIGNLTISAPNSIRAIDIKQDYAYIAVDQAGLFIIDITQKNNPIQVAQILTMDRAMDIVVDGQYAYVADEVGGLVIIDVSNPTNPYIVSNYTTPNRVRYLYKKNNIIFLSDFSNGLFIVDISNPISPQLISSISTGTGINYHGISLSDNLVYLCESTRVSVININDLYHPFSVNSISIAGTTMGLFIRNRYMYVVLLGAGLKIFNIRNPVSPELVGYYMTGGSIFNVINDDIYAYLPIGNNLLIIRNDQYLSNQAPFAAQMRDINFFDAGRVLTKEVTFSSEGSYDIDGAIDSIFWYIDGQLVSTDTAFTYSYRQGTSRVKLVVKDNGGECDSSFANVNISIFKKYFNGPVYAGLSLMGNNLLYATASGDAVYQMDIDGNINYPLAVGGGVLSSSSMAYDSTVYIASTDRYLYAFSKYGVPVWSPIPLGGELSVTPTVDSISNRIFIGVSNKNFFVIDRTTGMIKGSFFSDAAIVNSAVVNSGRKLIFSTVKGTIYGVDLNNLGTPNITPDWTIAGTDTISSSPAIDDQGYFYVGTKNGLLKKISMQTGLQGTVVWETILGGEIIPTPVIDANGNLYVGSTNSKFYLVERTSGLIRWSITTKGPVKTTAAISNNGIIYFGDESGRVYAVDSLGEQLWYYQDSTAIGSAILHYNGTTYIGTLGGRVLAFYDGGILRGGMETTNSPMWGTFQGNNRRTGSQVDFPMSINKEDTKIPTEYILYQNYPNPFNVTTIINYSLPYDSKVIINIYNALGQDVKMLKDEIISAGNYEVQFNAASLTSGVYFYRLRAESLDGKHKFSSIKKMIFLK